MATKPTVGVSERGGIARECAAPHTATMRRGRSAFVMTAGQSRRAVSPRAARSSAPGGSMNSPTIHQPSCAVVGTKEVYVELIGRRRILVVPYLQRLGPHLHSDGRAKA
jgi:hypothetical protein